MVELQQHQPKANYTDYRTTLQKVKILGDTMGTAGEIIVLIKYSPKRGNLLGKIKEQIECNEEVEIKANSISKLSKTRWTLRAECFKILDNYKELLTLWKLCLENDDMATEVISRIVGVKKQMEKFDFSFGLNIGHRLYSHTDNLSKTLQAEKMSACTSKRTAELVLSVLEGLRNEDSFKSLFQIITDNATTIDFIEQPQYSILHYVNGNQSTAQAHRPVTAVEADILRTIFRQSKSDCFRDILDEVEYLPKGQLCFLPNAVKILELLLVNPAATAKPERSFSLTRRIKI